MLSHLRTTGLAWAGTLIIVLAMSGMALGSVVLTADEAPLPDEGAPLVDTAATFEDADGDGVDDDCDDDVVPDAAAAEAAEAAADADGDGTISVSEAAQSGRIGGKNCNHGGYVSQVARDLDETEETEEADEADETDETEEAACEEIAAPVYDPEVYSGPGGFGRYVSEVAESDAIGGKNCNHGGAVSEAVKAAKEQARAERDAAKAERRAEREAAKAERRAGKPDKPDKPGKGGGD